MSASKPLLPDPEPERPERPDCCGGGCAVCVLDGYFEDVQRWEREVAAWRERSAAGEPGAPELDSH